ncbi:MAG TPA: FIST N-terminal domain-containing protein [Phycisphaerae bacterium]|nr:FIST N-terminal domain-containing protein [Phycisphaerae bacterium]HNU44536.1 FIST N-terminal domain-containing protein [Phycisphaerae bacterium]
MRFASAISANSDGNVALSNLFTAVDRRITRGMVDLVVFFCTPHFEEEMDNLVTALHDGFSGAIVLGCTGEGTLATEREVERRPSMSLLAACLPGVRIQPFHVRQPQLDAVQTHHDWERLVGAAPESRPVFITLADPFRLNILGFVEQISQAYPQRPLFGGVASAGSAPGENRLILDGEILRDGAVGVALTGNLDAIAVVSQGCRPIGKPFVITKGEHNIVQALGGLPALTRLQSVLTQLSPEEEKLARQSLFLGRAIDEYRSEFGRGDFLIHSILGADKETGALAIAGPARVGTTVQFHVRDAKSADEDLRTVLAPYAGSDVRGGLLFGCNGRGTRMWPRPGHDVGVLRELLGDVPVAGFFCAGEFGPVGGRNFVHGFTASIALFRAPEGDPPEEDEA